MNSSSGTSESKNSVSAKLPSKVKVLLITNCYSDNVGDQVIEACDVSLIRTAIDNLGISQNNLTIMSKDLSIVPNAYCETDDEELLKNAYSAIEKATLVLFGGAPVFNYAYQVFYKKTATLLKIARELNKPVIFSAIGIDSYDDANPKCQLLKTELQNGSVVQITTRDGIEHLQQYATPSPDAELSFPISLVSDPAVFAQPVFKKQQRRKLSIKRLKRFAKSLLTATSKPKTKPALAKNTIGIFIFRAGGFVDNGIKFNRKQQCQMWMAAIEEITSRGYDYELLTSGHFGDEAAIKYLIDHGYVKANKCVQVINTPEDLVSHISSYKAVISCRLHPSIISFAYNVPAVGLIWNSKVTDFYKHIGYPERAISVSGDLSPEEIAHTAVCRLEEAIARGIEKDQTYIDSVYKSLIDGIAGCLHIQKDSYSAYTGNELVSRLYQYPGTTIKMERAKVRRKLARVYRTYNKQLEKHR